MSFTFAHELTLLILVANDKRATQKRVVGAGQNGERQEKEQRELHGAVLKVQREKIEIRDDGIDFVSLGSENMRSTCVCALRREA